jgi:ABC-type phosphate/phosphonate transport system substrate-binding protein
VNICKTYIVSFVIAAGIISSAVFCHAEDKFKGRFVLGYAMKTLYDVDMKDAQAAFNLWGKELGEQSKMQVDIRMYDTTEDLLKDFRQKKIDFAMVKTIDYFNIQNKDNIDNEHALTNVRNGKKGHKYLILVRSDKPFSHIKDLRQKKVTVIKWDEIGMLYLDVLLMKNRLPSNNSFLAFVEDKNKASQVVLSVFFGQSDACLIPDVNYQTITELNPQIKLQMRVLTSSENMLAGVGFFRQDYDDILKKIVLDAILNMGNTVRGKQILLLFKSEKFTIIEAKDLDPVGNLLKDYRGLVQKEYKVKL